MKPPYIVERHSSSLSAVGKLIPELSNLQSKILKIWKGLSGILLRSGKCRQHLNFGLNWTQGVKVKHCWALSTNFLFSVQYKADSKQNMVFSAKSWMGAKIQIFLNYRSLTRFHQGFFKSFGLYCLADSKRFIWVFIVLGINNFAQIIDE